MKIRLERYSISPTETEGQFFCPGLPVLASLEPAWANNQKGVSCVPNGIYQVKTFTHPKLGKCLWLQSEENNVYWNPSSNTQRSSILLHPANFSSQLRGCIALGRKRSFAPDSVRGSVFPTVLDSRVAVASVVDELNKSSETIHELTIHQRQI